MTNAYVYTTPAVALSAAATKTVIQVASNSNPLPLRLKMLSISFDGVDATKTPIQIDLLRQSSAGTMTSLTGRAVDQTNPNVTPTAITGSHSATAEPTAGDVLGSWYVTPAGGVLVIQNPLGDEQTFTGRLALRCITASGVTCNAIASLTVE